MGAVESPERKRRRHDSPQREQHHREGDRHRSRHEDHDRSDRAGTSGRGHHDREQQQLVGDTSGSSRHHSDSSRDKHRDRSRERHHERDRQREREPERDREGDRYGSSRGGGHGDRDRPSREGRDPDGGKGDRQKQQQQQQERPMGPPRQREHSERDGRGGGGPDSRQQQRGGQEEEGKPKWGKPEEWAAEEPPPAAAKEAPNLGLSGKLAAETNKTADGTSVLKFQPPAEARVCKQPVWKLFVYKGEGLTGDPISLTQMPYYLFGKHRGLADIPTDHPSCSRQHAVLVFREVTVDGPDGISYTRTIKPYLLDLETINGTSINGDRLEPARYYELLSSDVIRFGCSSREYVIMNEAVVQ